MNCYEVQKLLVAYLEGEISPGERAEVEAHLGWCAACQTELQSLSATRQTVGLALHHLGDPVEPPLQAWEQLEARLAKEDRSSPASKPELVTNASQVHTGGIVMSGKFKLALGLTVSGAVIAALLALVGYFAFKTPTPVSAQEIIQRASAAQAAQAQKQGIQHRKTERYQDFKVLASGMAGGDTLNTESFLDPQTSRYRNVTVNAGNGYAVDVSGFDGTYLYASQASETAAGASPLAVYKSPAPDGWAQNYGYTPGDQVDEKAIFEQLSKDPTVEVTGQEKWIDGRQVYVLRSSLALTKFLLIAGKSADEQGLKGYSTVYFDAKTYQMVENKASAEVNGKELVITDFKILLDEILPASTAVAWDLSDVQGITLAEDPNGEKTGPWLQNTTPQDLASAGLKAYKLKAVPEGFVENISISEPGAQEQVFMITYRSATGDYVVIQGPDAPQAMIDQATETYKTASGLTVYLVGSDTPPVGMDRPEWTAVVETPDGRFIMNVNLPLERVKQLAEDLVAVN